MNNSVTKIFYEMRLVNTTALTGYFDCVPSNDLGLDQAFNLIDSRPMDSFLHRHVLGRLCSMAPQDFFELVGSRDNWSPCIRSLFLEAGFTVPDLRGELDVENAQSTMSPLINLRSYSASDKAENDKWVSLLRENIVFHKPLSALIDTFNSMLRSSIDEYSDPVPYHVAQVFDESFKIEHDFPKRVVSSTGAYTLAKNKLEKFGVLVDSLMRHVSSLSPAALLQKWRLERMVESGRNVFDLSATHAAYGKGLNIDDAMASCMMEVVERYCSYAEISDSSIIGCAREVPIVLAPFSELDKALDPSTLRLEVPYMDEPIWWMEGERITSDGSERIKVPVQLVYLFSNLDEPDLFSGLGSTGLAAHTEMAAAKVSALLECIERDSDTVSLFDPSSCFRIKTSDPDLSALFSAYEARGIHPQFQDISSEMGIPCFRCYVVQEDGSVVKGTGAGLSSKKALASALLETPYPFPYGPPSGPFLGDLPTRDLEDFPEYETGNPFQNLFILERTLVLNGYSPVYVDLTRSDLGFPVVKAVIPGFELMNDFDEFSRVSPRMKSAILKALKKIKR